MQDLCANQPTFLRDICSLYGATGMQIRFTRWRIRLDAGKIFFSLYTEKAISGANGASQKIDLLRM